MKLSFYQSLKHQNRKLKYFDYFHPWLHATNIHRESCVSQWTEHEWTLSSRGHKPEFVFQHMRISPPILWKKNNILRPQSYSMWTTVHISMTRPTIGNNWHVASDVLREICMWERTGCPFHQLERCPQGGIDWWGPMVWLDPVVCGVAASSSSSSDISELGDFSARPRRHLLCLSVPLLLSCQHTPSHPPSEVLEN